MRRPTGGLLTVAVVVGVVAVPLNVRAEAAGQSSRATAQPSAGTLQGSIIAVNRDKRRLQLREQDGRIVTVPIDPAAKIMREGRASSLSELSVGQTVSVQQAHRNGQNMATVIEVLPGSAGAAGAPGPNRGLQSVPSASPGGAPPSGATPGSSTTPPSSSDSATGAVGPMSEPSTPESSPSSTLR